MERMKREAADDFQRNVKKLGELFPSCVRERKNRRGETIRAIDLRELKRLLGEGAVWDERYEFTWPGKREALLEAESPAAKVLRPVPEESLEWDVTKNLYIEGDSLDALKLLKEKYRNAVKVMYIDPPYNTGKDFVYSDDFRSPEKKGGTDKEMTEGERNYPFRETDIGERLHAGWCSMILSRLAAARELLREDGVIFISIDDCEQENLKKICGEVFGEKNYVNTFIWNCSTAGGIRPRFASRTHEYVYCYAKDRTKLKPFRAPLSGGAVKMYNRRDEKGRLYRDKDFVFKNKSRNRNQRYEILCPDGERVLPKEGYIYRYVRERFEQALGEGLVTFKRTENGPLETPEGEQAHWNIYIKKYLGDATGAPSTLLQREWVSLYNGGTQCVQELFDGVRVFENVKPVSLIRYLVEMAAEDGDIVMDFFSGSASTAHAVMQTAAEKKLDLHYIMIQLPEKCGEESEARRAGFSTICEIGKERIRRAAERLGKEAGDGRSDLGFRVYRVEDPGGTEKPDLGKENLPDPEEM